jgi:hypothetical protein
MTTTDTPRTISAMSLKKNYDLSEKDCPVYENYVHAEVCAEIERELTASKAEVERLKVERDAAECNWREGDKLLSSAWERAEKAKAEVERLRDALKSCFWATNTLFRGNYARVCDNVAMIAVNALKTQDNK